MVNRWSIFLNAEARRSASTSLTIVLQQTQVSELRNATKRKEPNPLDVMMKTSVPETEEVIVEHLAHLVGQNVIHVFQKTVTRGIPPFGGCLDESLRNDVQGVARKFPRPRPVKGCSD
jgi:hypothetical protein